MNYSLTIKKSFEAIDDIEARQKAREMIEKVSLENVEIKLQEILSDKAPRKVSLMGI